MAVAIQMPGAPRYPDADPVQQAMQLGQVLSSQAKDQNDTALKRRMVEIQGQEATGRLAQEQRNILHSQNDEAAKTADMQAKGFQATKNPDGTLTYLVPPGYQSLDDKKKLADIAKINYDMSGKGDTKKDDEKSSQHLKDTQQMLESMRGNPAVQKAENDIYSAQKANNLVKTVGDPNNMDPTMFNLYKSEVGKIANGGQSSIEELRGLDPHTLTGSAAKAWETLTGDITPANLGNFVKQYQSYTNSIKGDAQKLITDRYGRIIDLKKDYLRPKDVDNLNRLYIGRFDSEGSGGGPPHPQDSQAVQWAKANSNDPRAAQILQANGVK